MTGEQHTDHISSGQRVSRHSLPTLSFLFFPHRTKYFGNSSKAQLAHLQAAQANAQTQTCKRANSPTRQNKQNVNNVSIKH